MVEGGCDEHRIDVVAPGFDFTAMRAQSQQPLPEAVQTWLEANTTPVIAQVGMLRCEKGHDTTLKALAALKRAGYALRYLIVGDGPYREQIIALIAQYGLENEVLMTGKLFPVSALYPHVDLLLMPSRNESFGMVLVEAMYFNVPVMASNVGGIPDVVHHQQNGVLLPTDDVAAWQTAIADYLHHPAIYRELAQRAVADVVTRYSIATCATRILQLAKAQVNPVYEPSDSPL